MKVEDVPGKCAEMLLRAFGHTPHNFSQAQAALAAVAPLIAAAEREACAKVAKEWDKGRLVYNGTGDTIPSKHGSRIAAAIRARIAAAIRARSDAP